MRTALPNGCTPLGSEASAASQEESQSLTCDFSACKEFSPDSPDNDCCATDDDAFCPQGYVKSKVLTSQPGVRWINAPAGFAGSCPNTAPYNGNTCCHSAQTPTLCIGDDSKCSSFADDCCACDASIGQTTCGWEEPATCRDGYVAVPTPGADGGMHGNPSCEYSCYPPGCGSSLVYVAEPQDYEGAQAACAERGGALACISSEAEALGTAWTGDREIWIADSAEGSYDTCTSSDCPCISCALASERKPFICDARSAGGSAPPTDDCSALSPCGTCGGDHCTTAGCPFRG